MSLTPEALVAEIRNYSGLRNNKFYSDQDIIGFASDALQELYDIVVLANEHYFKRNQDFTLSGGIGANTNLLPTDFYKEILLERSPDTTQVRTVPMLSNEVLKNQGNGTWVTTSQPRVWSITGDDIALLPPQNAQGDYRLIYVPQLETLVLPDPIDLGITYSDIPVNVTVRLVPTTTAWPNPTGWDFLDDDHVVAVIPPTQPLPLTFDGRELQIGDVILFLKDAAPGQGIGVLDPTKMGFWVFNGTFSSSDLFYDFRRLTGYENGVEYTANLKVTVTDGDVYGGAVLETELVSEFNSWIIGTNTVDFHLSTAKPIHVDLITTSPLVGDWTQPVPYFLRYTASEDPDAFHIDGADLQLGDIVFFQHDDAPIDPTNMGPWIYFSLTNSSPVLQYAFVRPIGLTNGDIIPMGQNIFVERGTTQRGVTFMPRSKITLGTSGNVDLLPLNFLNGDTGECVLQNGEFDPSYVNGILNISGSPLGDRAYRITAVEDSDSITLEAISDELVSENFGEPTEITATRQGERTTIPQALTPWTLFVKIHASISIAEGRSQTEKVASMSPKLERERQRVTAMSANRREDVTQAPITRRNRPFGGGFRGY